MVLRCSEKWLYSGFSSLLKGNIYVRLMIWPLFPSFCTGKSQGEQVEQLPSSLIVQEGASVLINCSYTDSASVYFPWYKQEPGKRLQFIIDIRSNMERKQTQRLTLLFDKKTKHLSLHITATQPGDSAIYFCSASTQCSPGTCSLSSNLPPGWSGTLLLCQTFHKSIVILFVNR